jgi:hypothetical protein
MPVYKLGPTESLPEKLPPLYGFVRRRPRSRRWCRCRSRARPSRGSSSRSWRTGITDSASRWRSRPTRTKEGKLGWDRDWVKSPMYAKFWEQMIDWSLRRSSRAADDDDGAARGKVRVILEARDEAGKPMVNLDLRGGVSTPDSKADDPRHGSQVRAEEQRRLRGRVQG